MSVSEIVSSSGAKPICMRPTWTLATITTTKIDSAMRYAFLLLNVLCMVCMAVNGASALIYGHGIELGSTALDT
jgi:hypothetical protein